MANQNKQGGLASHTRSHPQYSQETFEKLIDQQTERIKLNQMELALQEKAEANNFEFSKIALQAQKEDRNEGREGCKNFV